MDKRFRFTDLRLAKLPLPPPGQRLAFYDTEQPALALRVSPTGTKTFCVFRRVRSGQPERVTLGRYPNLCVHAARAKAAQVVAAISDGANPAAVKRAHRAEPTFDELFVLYLDRAKAEKRSWRTDEVRYSKWIKPALGNLKLSRIDSDAVRRVHQKATVANFPGTANRALALISAVFKWGTENGHCDKNPARGIRRNTEKSRERFLQPNELPAFFEALATEPNTSLRDFWLVSLLTGQRRGNVAAMRWEEVDLQAAEWRIPLTKNGTAHTVPLVPEVIEILCDRRASIESEWVFPARSGNSGYMKWPYKAWKKLCDRAGLKDLRVHDLRRSLGSWQARGGASLALIGKTLNHKCATSTLIYARLDTDPVREAMEKATSSMLAAGKVKSDAEVIPIPSKMAGK